MRLLTTIVICLTIVYEGRCMPRNDETPSMQNTATEGSNTFLDKFGIDFSQYYYDSDHTFMGTNTKIYKAYTKKKNVQYDLLNNKDVLPELMDVSQSSPIDSPQETPTSNQTHHLKNDTAYVRIVVIADYNIYKQHNEDIKKVVEYVTRFWTGVDLVYRQLHRPHIRINIAGIIVATDKEATSYFVPFIFGLFTNSDKTLDAMTDITMEKLFNFQNIILAGMTNKFLTNGNLDTVYGTAYISSACTLLNSRLIVRDRGAYIGIVTAVHELAHSLGAPHDEEADGFVMDKNDQTSMGEPWANRMIFSNISQQHISAYFARGSGYCFKRKPDVGTPIKMKLPGVGVSLDDQCKNVYGSKASADMQKKGHEVCEHLWCVDKHLFWKNTYEKSHRAPAEGSICQTGPSPKICLKAACVAIPKELESSYA